MFTYKKNDNLAKDEFVGCESIHFLELNKPNFKCKLKIEGLEFKYFLLWLKIHSYICMINK